jgi:hypothetical protein
MRTAIKVSALMVALGGGLGLLTAQQRGPAHDDVTGSIQVAIIDDYDKETTGGLNLASAPRLSLSDEQKGWVFLGVINLRDIPELVMLAPEPGVPLTQTVELHEIPAMVVAKIPEVQGYRFVKLEDRILLVSVDTRQVEATIPRYKLIFR